MSESKVIIQNYITLPPRVGGFEPPGFRLLLSCFVFFRGGGSIRGVQHSPNALQSYKKSSTWQNLHATFSRFFRGFFRLSHTIQKIVHAIIAYTARKKLPDEISSSKEKMKTQFKSLMTMASFNIGFALSMMAL